MTSSRETLAPGRIIAGRYELLDELGGGGMAVVYRGRHTTTGKICAVKFMRASLGRHEKMTELFLREARVGGRLSHPNIVEVYDAGLDETLGVPFIAMQLLNGRTLSGQIRAEGPLPHGDVLGIIEQLGAALASAHAAGVVHRDLKPGNIFLHEDERGTQVKVLDFGIAKILDSGEENAPTATEIGTPWYGAPEQLGKGLRRMAENHGYVITRQITPRTDIWPLGLIVYEMLTGLSAQQYWNAVNFSDLLVRLAMDELRAPSSAAGDRVERLPSGFDMWFLRCVARNAQERWSTVVEATETLARLLRLEPMGAMAAAATIPGGPVGAASPATPPGTLPAPPSSAAVVAAAPPSVSAVAAALPAPPSAPVAAVTSPAAPPTAPFPSTAPFPVADEPSERQAGASPTDTPHTETPLVARVEGKPASRSPWWWLAAAGVAGLVTLGAWLGVAGGPSEEIDAAAPASPSSVAPSLETPEAAASASAAEAPSARVTASAAPDVIPSSSASTGTSASPPASDIIELPPPAAQPPTAGAQPPRPQPVRPPPARPQPVRPRPAPPPAQRVPSHYGTF